MIITKFKTYTWRVFAVYMSFFSGYKIVAAQSQALAADIPLSQLISFQNRDISHVEVVMSNKNGWNINYHQIQQSLKLGNLGNINCLYASWNTRAYVAGIDYFQTLDFYQIKNGQNIISYRTNSLKKYQELLNQFTNKTVGNSNEFESLMGNSRVQQLMGGLSWEYAIENIDYESEKRYTILLYKTSLVGFVKSQLAWDQVVSNEYEEESLIEYITKYPNSVYIGLAKTKLEEKRYYSAYNGGSVDEINQFLAEYPQSKYVGLLRTKIEDLSYNQIFNVESELNELNIDKFIDLYPNSRYVKGLLKKKEELKFNALLLSEDEGLLYGGYINEKDIKKRATLLTAIQKLRYEKVLDSIESAVGATLKISILVSNLKNFTGTEYFEILEGELHKIEYEQLPQLMGEKCEEWQSYVQRYPNSVYSGQAKSHAIKCSEYVKLKKILDSAWQVYRGLNQNDYKNLISTGEFILSVSQENNAELKSQIASNRKALNFAQERRYKLYPLNEINPDLYNTHYKLLERQLINNIDGLRNTVINSSLIIKTDTFGKTNLSIIGSNSRFFESEVVDRLSNKIGGLNYYQSLPVMTTETHNVKYSCQSSTIELLRVGKGNFQLTKNAIPSPGNNKVLSIMNGDRSYFKSGKYRIIWDEVHINNKTVQLMSIDKYKSFAGVSAVLPALVVPGWGTKLVRGRRGNAWITISTYGLATAGIYFATQSQKSYENYLIATTQNEMDQHYSQYLSQRNKSLISIGGALGIYSLNLTYVIFKGMGNSIKTVSYRNRYNNYSKELN
ncbi:MAG: hypothetical protein ACKO7P_10970 [Bacteroidota bacterium]